jgi:hypothetical protein
MSLPFLCRFQLIIGELQWFSTQLLVGVMGGDEAKIWFEGVCKVKYRVRYLKGQPQYIVVKAFGQEVMSSAISLSFAGNQLWL